jgi:Family of unknown function (DUF6153)
VTVVSIILLHHSGLLGFRCQPLLAPTHTPVGYIPYQLEAKLEGKCRPVLGAARGARSCRYWLPLVVAALIVGILGMHALNLPGVGMPHMSVTAAGHDTPGMSNAHLHEIVAGSAVEVVQSQPPDGPHPDMAMLCVGMLVAGALMIPLLRSLARRLRPMWVLPHLPARCFEQWHSTPGGVGPPYVWENSVTRC